MHTLVGTTSVHTTAATCDYLDERGRTDDTVTVVAVAPADDATARRDAREALNVAPVRLAAVGDVRTELRTGEGDPADVLLEVAATAGVDEIVVTADLDGESGPVADAGSTARSLLEARTYPIVVVPNPDLDSNR